MRSLRIQLRDSRQRLLGRIFDIVSVCIGDGARVSVRIGRGRPLMLLLAFGDCLVPAYFLF